MGYFESSYGVLLSLGTQRRERNLWDLNLCMCVFFPSEIDTKNNNDLKKKKTCFWEYDCGFANHSFYGDFDNVFLFMLGHVSLFVCLFLEGGSIIILPLP